MKWLQGLILVGLTCSPVLVDGAETLSGDALRKTLQGLELPGVQEKSTAVLPADFQGYTVFCFLGTECPLAKLYGPRLEELARKFDGKPVRFLGVSSNLQDSLEEVAEYVKSHDLRFPFVKDYDHRLANLVQATRTPEVVVLDPAGAIVYQGRIDDQYQPGTAKNQAKHHYLEQALQELLAGKRVTIPATVPVGCVIGRAFEGEVTTSLTYCNEIARILQKHCVECHRSQEIGPFSLTDYDEVIGWGEMMLEVVNDGRMPPWHANPAHGEFANARHMTSEEKQQLKDWVRGGMPFGDVKNLPAAENYLEGWQLARTPDLVLNMSEKPFRVIAEGVIEYQYFVVDPGFQKDQWVVGAQVLPGNRAVVHHCIVFVRPPDGEELRGMGWVAAYVPGQRSVMLPSGYGRRLPAGSQLVFQMHYTPTGTEQQDLTQLGLLLSDGSDITQEVYTLPAMNRNFEIPPQVANYPVHGETSRVPRNGKLLALSPHMHYRGRSFRAEAVRADGQEILLDVPYYDFNWQHVYELKQEISLHDVEKLRFTSWFDNSPGNPFNPDPTAYVTWGDQTWEEMAIAFYEIAIPRGEAPDIRRKEPVPAAAQPVEKPVSDAEEARRIQQFVDNFFERFDTNGDGVVTKGEMPLSQQRYGFKTLDLDRNGQIDRSEIETQYRQRKPRNSMTQANR